LRQNVEKINRDADYELSKAELFGKLSRYIPLVDSRLLGNPGTSREFDYLAKYLSALREGILVTSLHLSLEDYAFLNGTLFSAAKSLGGTWRTSDRRGLEYGETICRRQIACLVEISIRIQGIA
jgi:hypothetical protein